MKKGKTERINRTFRFDPPTIAALGESGHATRFLERLVVVAGILGWKRPQDIDNWIAQRATEGAKLWDPQ